MTNWLKEPAPIPPGAPRAFYVEMPANGVLTIKAYGRLDYLEIRGTYGQDENDPFQQAIDAMPSGHASGLFSGQEIPVSPTHPSYTYFAEVWIKSMVDMVI